MAGDRHIRPGYPQDSWRLGRSLRHPRGDLAAETAGASPIVVLTGLDDERVGTILRHLKDREHKGYHYEAADASFELLLRQCR